MKIKTKHKYNPKKSFWATKKTLLRKLDKREKMPEFKASLIIRQIEEIVDLNIRDEYKSVLIKYIINEWRKI